MKLANRIPGARQFEPLANVRRQRIVLHRLDGFKNPVDQQSQRTRGDLACGFINRDDAAGVKRCVGIVFVSGPVLVAVCEVMACFPFTGSEGNVFVVIIIEYQSTCFVSCSEK